MLWQQVVGEYVLDDAGLHVLAQACLLLDRATACREAIERDGLEVKDRFGCSKPHPLLAEEARFLGMHLRALRSLGLDLEPVREPGRPASSPLRITG